MKIIKKNEIGNVFSLKLSKFIVLFAHRFLSPLQLASFYSDQQNVERQKRLNQLVKKLILILNNHEPNEEENIQSLDYINHIRLFYRLYSQRQNLSLKELVILRDFGRLLYYTNGLTMMKLQQEMWEDENYYQCFDKLEKIIESKRIRKKN